MVGDAGEDSSFHSANGPDVRSLGSRLRARRQERGLTIQKLAEQAGVSPGLISLVERGIGNPALMTLAKIAYALDLGMSRLFEGPETASQVVRKHARKRLRISQDEATFELLTPSLQQQLEVVWVEYAPGISTKDRPYQHKGEECGVVLQGLLEVHVGGDVHLLAEGDSIWIDSTVPHWYVNPGTERCTSIWAITPPSF